MTLIELMIVVTIIAILASVAVPKFADSVLSAKAGNAKGQLAAMRAGLALYYTDNNGLPLSCAAVDPNSTLLNTGLVPKYIDKIPYLDTGLHPATNNVYCDANIVNGTAHDGQGWYYDGLAPSDSGIGSIWIACDHASQQGDSWTSY
jgi:prepilin-type N-terminal cleavage/methylation domain-containing protein